MIAKYPDATEVLASQVQAGDSVSFSGVHHVMGAVTRVEHTDLQVIVLTVRESDDGPEVRGAFRLDDAITRWAL